MVESHHEEFFQRICDTYGLKDTNDFLNLVLALTEIKRFSSLPLQRHRSLADYTYACMARLDFLTHSGKIVPTLTQTQITSLKLAMLYQEIPSLFLGDRCVYDGDDDQRTRCIIYLGFLQRVGCYQLSLQHDRLRRQIALIEDLNIIGGDPNYSTGRHRNLLTAFYKNLLAESKKLHETSFHKVMTESDIDDSGKNVSMVGEAPEETT